MESNKLIMSILGVVVGIIVLGGVLAPVVSDAAETERTFTNSGLYAMTDSQPYVLEYYSAENYIVVNGENLGRPATTSDTSYIVTDVFLLRAASSYVRLVSPDSSSSSNLNLKISVEDNTATIQRGGSWVDGELSGSSTYTYEVGIFYGVADEGDYVMSDGTVKVVDETQIIYGAGTTNITSWDNAFFVSASVENGANVSVLNGAFDITNIKLNYTKLAGYEGYEVDSVTFTASTETISRDCTYSRVVVPAEVTITKEMGKLVAPLYLAIPALVLIAILLGVTATFAIRRNA